MDGVFLLRDVDRFLDFDFSVFETSVGNKNVSTNAYVGVIAIHVGAGMTLIVLSAFSSVNSVHVSASVVASVNVNAFGSVSLTSV